MGSGVGGRVRGFGQNRNGESAKTQPGGRVSCDGTPALPPPWGPQKQAGVRPGPPGDREAGHHHSKGFVFPTCDFCNPGRRGGPPEGKRAPAANSRGDDTRDRFAQDTLAPTYTRLLGYNKEVESFHL